MSNRPGNDRNRMWSTWIAFIILGGVLGFLVGVVTGAENPFSFVGVGIAVGGARGSYPRPTDGDRDPFRAGLCPAGLPGALITAAVTGQVEGPGAVAS